LAALTLTRGTVAGEKAKRHRLVEGYRMRIGFIGVGMMGHGMGLNILKEKHELWVIAHRNREPIDDLVKRGAYEALDLDTIAAKADVIMLCLSNARVVEETLGKLKPKLRTGQIVIDTGTSDPETTRKLARELA